MLPVPRSRYAHASNGKKTARAKKGNTEFFIWQAIETIRLIVDTQERFNLRGKVNFLHELMRPCELRARL